MTTVDGEPITHGKDSIECMEAEAAGDQSELKSIAEEGAHSMPKATLEIPPPQEHVIIGGCGSLLQVPASQQGDYFRAHGFVAILGAICWLLFFFTGLIF